MLSHIPKDKTPVELEKHLLDLFEMVKIEKIVYSYDIYDIIHNLRLRQRLEDKIEKKERAMNSSMPNLPTPLKKKILDGQTQNEVRIYLTSLIDSKRML